VVGRGEAHRPRRGPGGLGHPARRGPATQVARSGRAGLSSFPTEGQFRGKTWRATRQSRSRCRAVTITAVPSPMRRTIGRTVFARGAAQITTTMSTTTSWMSRSRKRQARCEAAVQPSIGKSRCSPNLNPVFSGGSLQLLRPHRRSPRHRHRRAKRPGLRVRRHQPTISDQCGGFWLEAGSCSTPRRAPR